MYSIARLFGRERTRWFLAKLPFMETSDIDKTEAFFEKHERAAVFFGRLLPIFRSLISLPAGVIKMNLPLFIAFTALGSAVWNTALIYAGYILGENWGEVEVYISLISKIIIGAAVLAVLVWAAHKFWLRKKSNP
ncbi:DedA family protein [Arcanobacterium hippocoleae]